MDPWREYIPGLAAPILGLAAWLWAKHFTKVAKKQIDARKRELAEQEPEFPLTIPVDGPRGSFEIGRLKL